MKPPTYDLPADVRQHANRVICAVADEQGVLLSDIIIGAKCYRRPSVANARAAAVLRLRNEIVQRQGPVTGKPEYFAVRTGDIPKGWIAASTVTLAAIFNADHSTIVRVLNRAKLEQSRRAETPQRTQSPDREGREDPGAPTIGESQCSLTRMFFLE